MWGDYNQLRASRRLPEIPHATLAHLKDTPLHRVHEFLAAHNLFDSGPFAVKFYSLFSSHQTARGSLYRPERTYPLSD